MLLSIKGIPNFLRNTMAFTLFLETVLRLGTPRKKGLVILTGAYTSL